jgi:hypothetical protein
MKIYITLLLGLLFISTAFAEEDEFQVAMEGFTIETIYLSSDISAKVLDFDNAQLDDAFGLLPAYIYRIGIKSD